MFLPSQYWDIVSMLCPWARYLTLKYFTWHRWKWEPGRTEVALWRISSMRRNGCRTVCSPWSWGGTRMNKSSDRGECKKSDYIFDISTFTFLPFLYMHRRGLQPPSFHLIKAVLLVVFVNAITHLCSNVCYWWPGPVFSYKLRYIVGFGLVEMVLYLKIIISSAICLIMVT